MLLIKASHDVLRALQGKPSPQTATEAQGGAWPLNTGNDFLPNHLANGIDYGSIHMWPDNWGRTDLGFGK